ncbi:MAG: hypothetical protein H7Y38_15170 [Armatimonadetes bacterium]|nr:hypothetical protein [Armatimonadota bacterium]
MMPALSAEMLCADFDYSDDVPDDLYPKWSPLDDPRTKHITSDALYGYGYHTGAPAERLGGFAELQNLLFGATVENDEQFGWSLTLWEGNTTALLPRSGFCELTFGGATSEFAVSTVERSRNVGGHRTADGGWQHHYKLANAVRIYKTDEPLFLHQWLDETINVATYEAYLATRPQVDAPLYFVYVELLERGKRYALRPNLVFHHAFKRE